MTLLIAPERFEAYTAKDACGCHAGGGAETEHEVSAAKALPVSAFDVTLLAPAVYLQVVGGETDPDRITNAIFRSRHPELQGRKIARGEQTMAEEWRQLRDRVVVPTLKSVPENLRPPCGPIRCDHTDAATVARIKAIVPLLQRHRGDLPLGFLVGWIAVESGGSIASQTSLGERGFFQVHPKESMEMRLSDADHKRLSTDPDFSIRTGIELVRRKLDRVKQLGKIAPDRSEAHLGLAKLHHWLPSGAKLIVTAMAQRGAPARSWGDVRSFTFSNRQALIAQLSKATGRTITPCHNWDPAFGITTVDRTFKCGREIMQRLEAAK